MKNNKSKFQNKIKIDPTKEKLGNLNLKDRRLVEKFRIKKMANNSTDKTSSQDSKDIKNRPYISIGIKKDKVGFDISSISSHLSHIGLDTQSNDFDLLDLYASHIIELINEGIYVFSNLTKHEKFILFRYFYRSNPILGRIIDIHTEIPISKLRIQAPKNCPEIVKDYIVQFYERIFSKLNLVDFIRDMALHYWVYGEAYGLVDDYYLDQKRQLQDMGALDENFYNHSEENLKFMQYIEDRYKVSPQEVLLKDRLRYIEIKFMGFFNKDYNGPDRIRVLKFFDIQQYYHNEDIGFDAINYSISEGLKELIDTRTSKEELLEMGYSKGFLYLLDNPENKDRGSVLIENDVNSGEPYIFIFKRYESTSMLQRIFEACLGWENSKRALKAKIGQVGKLGRIVTSEELGEDQTNALRVEVEQMINDPNHAIVANYPISWQEVNSFIKEELNELIQSTSDLKSEIATGTGMPDSLISGESQYSGDSIKLDILNNQYFAFKVTVQNILEEKLMKPIALRKGFISVDSWGTPVLLYPKITFSRVSFRSEEYFTLLFDLYQKNSIPVSIIYDLLNLDADDITRAIQEDLFTLRDATFNDLIRNIYGQLSDSIVSKTELADKIIDGLGLPRKEMGKSLNNFEENDSNGGKEESTVQYIKKENDINWGDKKW
jgi:hypothetical protein